MEVRLKEAQRAWTIPLSELCEYTKHDDTLTVISHAKEYLRRTGNLTHGAGRVLAVDDELFLKSLLDGKQPFLSKQELQQRLDSLERLKKHVEEAEKRFDYARNVQYFLEAIEKEYS